MVDPMEGDSDPQFVDRPVDPRSGQMGCAVEPAVKLQVTNRQMSQDQAALSNMLSDSLVHMAQDSQGSQEILFDSRAVEYPSGDDTGVETSMGRQQEGRSQNAGLLRVPLGAAVASDVLPVDQLSVRVSDQMEDPSNGQIASGRQDNE